MSGGEIERLLRRLLELWSGWESSGYYVEELAPAIVRGDATMRLLDAERSAVEELRRLLPADEWSQLPDLLAACMCRVRDERAAREAEARDRPRLERERKEREAADRRAAEEAARRAEADRRRAEKDAVKERQRRSDSLRSELRGFLESDFLGVDRWYLQHPDRKLIAHDELASAKTAFVRQWVSRKLGYELDDEQAAAVAATGGHVLVTARAGSGKTRALVSRAIFLMTHCRVRPTELLLLAFNRKAVKEMHDRISAATGGEIPHIRTFHSLAYSLVRPEEELVFDDANAGSLKRSRLLQGVIDDHLHDTTFGPLIRAVMLEHFRSDWETIAVGGFDLSMSEFLARRRSLQRETLAGDYVKSYGEKLIANTLFEQGITYRYESNFKWNGRNYHPDFVIRTGPGSGVVIEYFGLQGEPDYDDMTEAKRTFWSTQPGWTLIEATPADVAGDPVQFSKDLIGRVTDLGIEVEPLSEEEIWEQVRNRAIDSFTSTMATFVSRCRKRGLTSDALHNLLAAHTSIVPTEQQFLRIAHSVHDRYVSRLEETSSEDFDGLMWRAVAALQGGHTRFGSTQKKNEGDLSRIRHVLVDEFQDFSKMFLEIANGIRQASPSAEFFCLGDDWQAINGFAGSELRFFDNFSIYFPRPQRVTISRNYRSPADVVAAGNAVMARQGTPARAVRRDKGVVLTCDLESFPTTAAEHVRHGDDVVSPAILRLIRRCLEKGEDVVLIARRNTVPWYVEYRHEALGHPKKLESFLSHVHRHLPDVDRRRVTISTAHGYKGLESDAVIVIDAVDSSYPLIHPSWVFLRLFGDSVAQIEGEERRLFYVALTRARQSLLLVNEKSKVSPFLRDVQKHHAVSTLNWTALKPVAALDGAALELCVYNAYDVRDLLKNEGFRFSGGGKFWTRAVPTDTDIEAVLRGSAWFRPPVKVEVTEDGELVATHTAS